MAINIKFRNLLPREIEVRAYINKDGSTASLLLYKNARTDANILDETVGNLLWKREHYQIGNTTYCKISIYSEKLHEWVDKSDCGDNYTPFEKKKTVSSDSFKRAATQFGIGRELYSAPEMIVPLSSFSNVKNTNDEEGGKIFINDELSVDSINTTDNKSIIGLAIKNRTTGQIIFQWGYLTKCPVCGEYIPPMRGKKGKLWKPEDILNMYHMCKKCFLGTEDTLSQAELTVETAKNAVVQYKDNIKKRPFEGTSLSLLNQQQLNTLVISNTITNDTKKAVKILLGGNNG